MSAPTTTSSLTMQDFFSTTLSSGITALDTVIPLNAVPNGTEGFLVIDQDNSAREIIYYSTKGGSSVTCPSAATGRGQGGTTVGTHLAGATVKLNVVSQYWKELQNGNAFATGIPVQMVTAPFSAVATGSTLIPSDDTKPQNTEGDEYMTLAITPKSATNVLVIEATSHVSHSVSTTITAAIFQGSSADALAASSEFQNTGTGRVSIVTPHTMVAGATTSITFKVRIGGANAGTTTFNGSAGARVYGGVTGSMLKITEYKAS
jgi:hypothetical protein